MFSDYLWLLCVCFLHVVQIMLLLLTTILLIRAYKGALHFNFINKCCISVSADAEVMDKVILNLQ